MIRRLALVALVASCQPVPAAVIPTWSGAGPNACQERCPEDWAVAQLTQEEQVELAAVRATSPEPVPVMIEDGTVFTLMSYFEDGAPVAYRTWTVAALSEVETSRGWVMDGWSFVKLHACDNWAVVKHGERLRVLSQPSQVTPARIVTASTTWDPLTFPPLVPPITPRDPDVPCCVGPPDPPSPVPLPSAVWLILASLGALFLLRRRHV